mmetsp:Transcript_7178/g.20839  ORF Transcript_7178/g.20839 Transcript_7178/m.20839 type:complete len:127 (+) Transcript_7178:1717-2097(+)
MVPGCFWFESESEYEFVVVVVVVVDDLESTGEWLLVVKTPGGLGLRVTEDRDERADTTATNKGRRRKIAGGEEPWEEESTSRMVKRSVVVKSVGVNQVGGLVFCFVFVASTRVLLLESFPIRIHVR